MTGLEPRYFWRRLAGFVVDYALASALALLVLAPFAGLDGGGRIRLGMALFSTSVCSEAVPAPEAIRALVAPKEVHAMRYCDRWLFGLVNGGRVAEVMFDVSVTRNGAVTRTASKRLVVAVDAAGLPVTAIWPQGLLGILILFFGSTALAARGRVTPGKQLFGLELGGSGCAVCRELRRLGPLVVLSAAFMMLPIFMPQMAQALADAPLWTPMVISGAIWLLLALYYLHPWLKWHGAMPWDRATGFNVVKAEPTAG